MPESPISGRPLPSSFDNDRQYQETALQKMVRRLKEEPLIPIGVALTVAAFVSAYRSIRRGDSVNANKMFRARVAAQGFTIACMVAGSYYYKEDREKLKELWMLEQKQKHEEKNLKWIRELEARDEEEKILKQALESRKKRIADERRAGGTGTEDLAFRAKLKRDAKKELAEKKEGTVPSEEEEKKKQETGGVLASLGGWFGKPKPEAAAEVAGSSSKPEATKSTEK
ncbi:hypoxia induced protein conserved region-domain-containing protein [Podospora fimiseda]|uniref:Hypoxia induced protein conserved region-domain-containing protein n=1 Tax=Podospora fimiseda TaxID=252190 RepID=A0AAN7BT97_9PEZI|nr:hypoxia induced protein conserved region-domain-containing protein [Podospora fimiseda]